MSNRTSAYTLQDILEKWDVVGEDLYNKLKTVADNIHIIKSKEHGSKILKEVIRVLQTTPVSYYDDLNHKIRNYCFQIIKRLTFKLCIMNDDIKLIMNVLFKSFSEDNELNGIIIIQVLATMNRYYSLVGEEVAEKYISQVETQYCNFYNSVKSFLIPPTNSNTMEIGSQNALVSSQDASGLPFITTGSQEVTKTRSRSLSIDYLNQPSFAIKRSAITNTPITKITDSILILDRVMLIMLGLFSVYSDLFLRRRQSLLKAIGTIVSTPVFDPSKTTSKQYIQYVRVLCYSLSYFVMLIKTHEIGIEYLDPIARTTIQILYYFPSEYITSSDIFIHVLKRLLEINAEVKSLKDSIPILTRSVFFPDEIFDLDKTLFAEHRISIIQQLVAKHINTLTIQDIQCVVHLYSLILSKSHLNSRYINYYLPQYKSFLHIMKEYSDSYRKSIASIVNSMLIGIIRKFEDLRFIIENEAKTRAIKRELRESDMSNDRYDAFVNGRPYQPPSPPYDENGIRYLPSIQYFEVGDIVVTASRFLIFGQCQMLASVLSEIMLFITAPTTDTGLNPLKSSIQFISFDRLIDYLYRYVVSICDCSIHFQIDESRTKGSIETYIAKFAEVLISLPDDISRQVLSLTIDKIYDTIKANSLFIHFIYTLIHNRKSFRYTATLIIDLICRNLKDLDTDEIPMLLFIFRIFSTHLNIALQEEKGDAEGVLKPYLRRLISDSFRSLIKTTHWNNYLDIVFGCLNFFHPIQHMPDLINEMTTIIKYLIHQLSHTVQVNFNPLIRERLLDIIYRIPFQKQQYQLFFGPIFNFYVKGLSGPDTLQKTVISSLDNVLSLLGEDVFYFLQMDNIRSSLMSSLQWITHNSYNTAFAINVLSLLGRLGGKTRSILKDRIDLPSFADTDEHFVVSFLNEKTWNIDRISELLLSFLHRNLIPTIDTKLNNKVCITVHCQTDSIDMMRNTRIFFKKHALHAVAMLLNAFCSNEFVLFNPYMYYQIEPSLKTLEQAKQLTYEDRCCCMMLFSVLLSCCDCELKEEAQAILKSFLSYLSFLFIKHVVPNQEGDSFWFSSPLASQETINKTVFGPTIAPLSHKVAVPPNALSPLLLAHPLLHLLERDDSFYSDVVIETIHMLLDLFAEICPDQAEMCGILFYDYFFSLFFKDTVTGGWRLKMNMLPVILDWCKHASASCIKRYSSILLHYIFNINDFIPHEYALIVKKQSETLIATIFLATFHIYMPTAVTIENASIQPELEEHEAQLGSQRMEDAVTVLVDNMFISYNLCQQLAMQTIIALSENPEASHMFTAIKEMLKQRHEFEKEDHLPYLKQISVFVTMELCLKWGVFTPLQKITTTVIHDAIRSVNNISPDVIKKYTEEVDPYSAELPTSGFMFTYTLEYNFFIVVMRLLCTYVYQRQQLNSDDPMLKDNTFCLHIAKYILLASGCPSPCIPAIINPVLPYLPMFIEGSNTPFDIKYYEDYLTSLTASLSNLNEAVFFELYQIERLGPYLSHMDKPIHDLAHLIIHDLCTIREFISSSHNIKENILSMVIRLFSALSSIPLTVQDFSEIFKLVSFYISSFSLHCITFGSVDMIYKPLAKMILSNKRVFIDFILSNMTDVAQLNILMEGVSTAIFAISKNNKQEFAEILSELWMTLETIFKNPHMKVVSCTFLRFIIVCLDVEDSSILLNDHVLIFLKNIWQDSYKVLSDTILKNNTSFETSKQIPNTPYIPVLFVEEDLAMFELLTNILIRIMKIHFDASFSNMLSFAFCHNTPLSFQDLKSYYQEYLPSSLTNEQRKEVLLSFASFLHDNTIRYEQLESMIMNSIIPLISATCNSSKIQNKMEIFTPVFFDAYTNYLSMVSENSASVSSSLLIALLQLNTLIIKHLYNDIQAYSGVLNTFGWKLNNSENKNIVAYSLLFMCQYMNFSPNKDIILRLFATIVHEYNNPQISVIYRAYQLLQKPIMDLSDEEKAKYHAIIQRNMQKNEHILNEQIHIWKLIIQNAEFFYEKGYSIFVAILNNIKSLSPRTNEYRELRVDLISLVTSFFARKRAENKINEMEINNHLASTAAQLLMYISRSYQDTLLYERGCDLLNRVFSLSPLTPLKLEDIDRSTMAFVDSNRKFTDEQLSQLLLSVCCVFKITTKSLIRFKGEFLELNAEYLNKQIPKVIEVIDRNAAFTSLIELLPELFAVKTEYTPRIAFLHSSIKDSMFSILMKDIQLINIKTLKKHTRVWRVLYLIQLIVDRNPSTLSLFTIDNQSTRNGLLYYMDTLLTTFFIIFKDPSTQRSFFNQDFDTFIKTNTIETFPLLPTLNGIELYYALLVVFHIYSSHITLLDASNHRKFIEQICFYFQSSKRAEFVTNILRMIRKWLEYETDVLSLRDLEELLPSLKEVRTLPDSIIYFPTNTEYWNFIYDLCVRYPQYLDVKHPLHDVLSTGIFSGMIMTNPEVRKNFRKLFLPQLPSSLYGRLSFIFSETRSYADKKTWFPLFVEVMLRTDNFMIPMRLSSMKQFPEMSIQSNSEQGEGPACVNNFISFINHANQQSLHSFMEDLIELAYGDMHIAYTLWVQLFPLAWSTFTQEQQATLTTHIAKFLTSDLHYHQQSIPSIPSWEDFDRNFKIWGSNCTLPYVTQSDSRYGTLPVSASLNVLLEGIIRCTPQPRISPVALLHLAESYNCSPQVSLLLEQGLQDCKIEKESKAYMSTLRKVYTMMCEDDAYASTLRSIKIPSLRNGITLERYNCVQTAQIAYLEGLRNQNLINSSELLLLLQERWKECAINLRQVKSLFEYGKLNHELWILLDCYGKSNIWTSYPGIIQTSCMVEKELMKPRGQLYYDRYQIIQLFNEGKRQFHPNTADLLLTCYRRYPMQPIVGYDSILHLIHQMNEINNACMLLSSNVGGSVSDDISQCLKHFNSFLMNEWDPLSKTEDILLWKLNVYTQFMNSIQNEKANFHSPQVYNLRLSRCARKLNLPEVAVEYITSITSESHSMYDTVEKWKERVRVAIDLDSHNAAILSEIDRFSLDSIKDTQKADINYTKGLFYMKDPSKIDEAINCFNHIIRADSKYTQAWGQYGKICYDRWKERGEVNDAKNCITCCVNQLRSNVDYANVMVRFLHIVFYSFDNATITQAVSNLFSSNNKIPNVNIWISFLPYLFSRPTETQMLVFHNVITELIRKCPYVVFYPLSTLCQSLEKSQTTPTNKVTNIPVSPYAKPTTLFNGTISCATPLSKQPDVVSYENAMYYYQTLLCRMSNTPTQLMLFMETLHSIPHDPYRELLASLDRILRTVYSEISIHGPVVLTRPVSQDIRTRLLSLCYISFNLENMVPSTFAFVQKYSSSFLHDFAEGLNTANGVAPNTNFPVSLEELLQRLLLWKRHMKECIANKMGDAIYEEFFTYNRCTVSSLEIPGQRSNTYINQSLPTLLSLRGHIPALYKEQHNWRHVDMIDENLKTYRFYLEQVNALDMLIEERTLYFQMFFDMMAQTSHPFQMRHMHSSLPAYIHITPSIRLVSTRPNSITLEGVYQEALGDAFDEKQLEYSIKIAILNHPQQEVPPVLKQWCSNLSASSVLTSVVPADLLTRYIFTHMNSSIDFYAFRSEFAKQYAYSQFMQRFFISPNDHPDKTVLNLKDGGVTSYNIHSNYVNSERGFTIHDRAMVPFRLTQNITHFLTEFYMGSFELALGSMALTLKRESDTFTGYAKVFERENVRLLMKPKNMNDREVKEMIHSNISIVLGRAMKYAPNVDDKMLETQSMTQEDVDKEIRDAVRKSRDAYAQVQASPSFCAWF